MIGTLLAIVVTALAAVICSYLYVNHYCSSAKEKDEDCGDGSLDDQADEEIEKCLEQITKSMNINPKKKKKIPTLKSQKRRIVVSKEVDRYIEKIIESFIDYYIITWYSPLVAGQANEGVANNNTENGNEEFIRQSSQSVETLRQVLKNNIWSILSTLIDRLYSVNYVNFVAISLINRVSKHLTVLHQNRNNNQNNLSGGNSGTKYSPSNNSLSSFSASSSNSSLAANSHYESVSSLTTQLPSSIRIDGTKFKSKEELGSLPSNQNSNDFDRLIFNLASHIASKKDENALLHCLSSFIVETLLKTTIFDEKSTLENSHLLKLLLSDFMALFLKSIIEKLSDPCFINYQIIRIIEKHIILKNLVFIEKLDSHGEEETQLKQLLLSVDVDSSLSSNNETYSSLKYFSLNDMKLCIIEHNFSKLFELLDQCEDIECLRHIRLYIIGEILDAAVINYLNKNEIQSKRTFRMISKGSGNGPGDKSNSQQRQFFDRVSSGRFWFKPVHQRSGDVDDQHDISTSISQKHFNFNANINSKVKQLRAKDLRRYLNQLRYAKTICEQKIHILKRNNASLLSPGGGGAQLTSGNSISDSFEISLSTEYIRALNGEPPLSPAAAASVVDHNLKQGSSFHSFVAHSPNSPISISDHLSFKPKSKKIFKFKVIMANEFSRSHFKRFLQNSLFNREHRSSWSKYRKDTLICESATYLVEFWEVIQNLFMNVTDFYQSELNGSQSQFASLHSLFSHSYLLILQIVTDSRFYYTFSSQFLQLPSNLLKKVENFLLGDIDLVALRQTPRDFNLEQSATPVIFDNELLAGYCLDTVDWDKFFNIFIVLEKIIFKCLCDEFYPQFLISNEYDEMLYSNAIDSIEIDREISSAKWSSLAKQLFNKNAEGFDLLSKPINKVSLHNDQIDIAKNRGILLNSLEFPFFGLLCLQFVCQRRLYVKVCIKDILTRYSCAEMNQFCLDVGQLVNRDIVYYYDIYSRLHSVITNVYCWLHSDITCQVSNLSLRPQSQGPSFSSSSSNFTENKFMSFMENIFTDSAHSNSSQSFGLFFHIQISTTPSNRLLSLPKSLQSELMSSWSSQWKVEQSIDELVQFFNRSIVPSVRLISYLLKYQLDDYLIILFRMMEQNENLQDSVDQTQPSVLKPEENVHYHDRLIKSLSRNITDIKRHLRIEIRDRQKRDKLKHKLDHQRLSFKKLLDNENTEKPNESSEYAVNYSQVNQSNSSWYSSSSTPIELISQTLNSFLSQLTSDPNISKMKGFLNFIKYESRPSQVMDTLADPGLSSSSCLRCLLYDHVGDNNCEDLTKFILHSLCSVCLNSGIDVQNLISNYANHTTAPKVATSASTSNVGNSESAQTSANFFETLQFPIGTAASKLFHTSSLPVIDGPNKSGQLFFLHSRSWLSEKTTPEILDYILSMFKYFDKFCPSCTEQLYVLKRFSNSLGPNNNGNSGGGDSSLAGSKSTSRGTRRIKFRLFNLDPIDRAESSNGDDNHSSSSSRAIDVANLKGSKCDISSTTSSLLNDAVDTNLFDDFSIEKFDLISSSLDDVDANLIEPLFQMLIEIFELKGTMTRTLRRTLMFGFQLVFGQTMLSKQLKSFLESIFTDSNVLYLLSLLDSYINELKTNGSAESGSSNKYQSKAEKVNTNNSQEDEGEEEDFQEEEEEEEITNESSVSNGESAKLSKKSAKLDSYLKDLDKLLDSIEIVNSDATVNDAFDETLTDSGTSHHKNATIENNNKIDLDSETAKFRRLQILAKQLLFASVPTFLNHLFGQENALTGLNKCFDILQYQDLNKQLVYEFIEAFLLEYFPEFKKI